MGAFRNNLCFALQIIRRSDNKQPDRRQIAGVLLFGHLLSFAAANDPSEYLCVLYVVEKGRPAPPSAIGLPAVAQMSAKKNKADLMAGAAGAARMRSLLL
jgi:hypothetical protein